MEESRGSELAPTAAKKSKPWVTPRGKRMGAYFAALVGLLVTIGGLLVFVTGWPYSSGTITQGWAVESEIVGTDRVMGDTYKYLVAYQVEGVEYRLGPRTSGGGEDPVGQTFEVSYEDSSPGQGKVVDYMDGLATMILGVVIMSLALFYRSRIPEGG